MDPSGAHGARRAIVPSWSRREIAALALVLGVWTFVYGWRGVAGHLSLRTSAYDLSVFDYALWNTLHGRLGFVPFYGYTIFSDHFMPILILLLPIYALQPSATLLVILQTLAVASAGGVYYLVMRRDALPSVAALALLLVFLISRWSHGASVSYFYPESFQPLLIFAMVLAWSSARGKTFWISLVLLLMTKEDAPLYVAGFAALQWCVARGHRRRAIVAFSTAVVWLVVAVFVAVPLARRTDGLPATYPFWETRLAAASGAPSPGRLFARLASRHTVTEIGDLLLTVGALPLLAPQALVPALAGVGIDLVTEPGSLQASLTGHYAWPILPWVFLAAAGGARRFLAWQPRVAWTWIGLLVAGTVADAPVIRHATDIGFDPAARAIRTTLSSPIAMGVLTLPNLVPHLPHTNKIDVLFDTRAPPPNPERVLLTTVGDLWPFSSTDVAGFIVKYQNDPRYEQRAAGPLYEFIRRPE